MNKNKVLSLCIGVSLVAVLNSPNQALAQSNNYYSTGISKTYTKIDSLIEKGDYKKAETLSKKLLSANPNNVKARAALGSTYSAQFKLDAAFKEFQQVLEQDPTNSDAHNGLGMIYYRKTTSSNMEVRNNIQKYYEMAIKEFEKAVALDSNNYKAYNNAGKILQESGQLDKAEEYYRRALDVAPDYSPAVMNLGTVLFAKNQVDEAIARYHKAILLNGKNSSAYYHLGEALIAKGDYSKAINYLNTSLYLFSNSAPVHNMLGKAYELQGNEAAAISEYKKSTLIKPEYPQPYLSIANIYQNRSDYELAVSELKNAISINPDFLEGKLKIADISLSTNKTDQAIKYYKEVIKNPVYSKYAAQGISKAYFQKAQSVNDYANFVSESEYVEAEQALKQAINYNPDDIQLYLALLRISRLTDQNTQSQSYLNKIIQSPSSHPINSIVKGEAFLTYKKYNDAEKEFEKALSFVSDKNDILYVGEIFVLNRQYDVAKNAFHRVLNMEPNNTKAQKALERIKRNEEMAASKYIMAEGLYDEGQKMAAIEMLREALNLNPSLPEAQLLLAKALEKKDYYYNAIEHYKAYIHLVPAYGSKYNEAKKKIEKLTSKVEKMKSKGKEVKKYTRI